MVRPLGGWRATERYNIWIRITKLHATLWNQDRVKISETLIRITGKLRQNPLNISDKPRITVVNRTVPLFQDPRPPISKDDHIEETVDPRLVYALPVASNPRNFTLSDLAPVRLYKDPPLDNAVLEGFEAIVEWNFVGASSGGPPRNCARSASGRKVATAGGMSKFKFNVTLEQIPESSIFDTREVCVDVILPLQEVRDLQPVPWRR